MASLSYMILKAKVEKECRDPEGTKLVDDQVSSAALAKSSTFKLASLSYMILKAKDEEESRDPEGTRPVDDQVPSVGLGNSNSKSKSKSNSKKQTYRSSRQAHNLYTAFRKRTSTRTRQNNMSEESPKKKMSAEDRTIHRSASEGTLAPAAPKLRDLLEQSGLLQELIDMKTIMEEERTSTVRGLDNGASLGQECTAPDAAADPPADDFGAVWNSVNKESNAESRTTEVSSVVYHVLKNAWEEIVTMDDQEPLPCTCQIAQVACVYHSTPNDKKNDEKDIPMIPSFQADITRPKPKLFLSQQDEIIMNSTHPDLNEIPTSVRRLSESTHQSYESIISEVTTSNDISSLRRIHQQQQDNDNNKLDDKQQKEYAMPFTSPSSRPQRQPSEPHQVIVPQPTGPFFNSPRNKSGTTMRLPSCPKDDSNPLAYPHGLCVVTNTYAPPSPATHIWNSPIQESCPVAPTRRDSPDTPRPFYQEQRVVSIKRVSPPNSGAPTPPYRRNSPDAMLPFSQEQRLVSVERVSPPNPGAPVPPCRRESDHSNFDTEKKKTCGLPGAPFGDDDQDAKSASQSSGTRHSSHPPKPERPSCVRVKHYATEISYTTMEGDTYLHSGFYTGPLNENGQMDGNGVFWLPSGDLYLGQFSSGDLHGVGALSLSMVTKQGNHDKVILKGYFEHNQFMGEQVVVENVS
jgi:hypothetical protein